MLYSAMQIADFIIDYCTKINDPVSNLRLQKLLYFAWVEFYKATERYLFSDKIFAWQLGPVVPEVYYEYCVYGGRPIYLYCETEINDEDSAILKEIIDEKRLVPVGKLVERTHMPDTAWFQIYDGGKGNRMEIPFDLIKRKEFGENYASR